MHTHLHAYTCIYINAQEQKNETKNKEKGLLCIFVHIYTYWFCVCAENFQALGNNTKALHCTQASLSLTHASRWGESTGLGIQGIVNC